MEPSKVFSLLTPFVILLITFVIIPVIKRKIDESKTFFELPTQVQIEAIDYISKYEKSKASLKSIHHKMKMEGYRLSENMTFSEKIIKFYYLDKSKNARFSRTLLKAQGIYKIKEDSISIRYSSLFLLLFFIVATFYLFFFGFVTFNYRLSFLLNFFSIVLMGLGFLYAYVVGFIAYQYIVFYRGKNRFNEFNTVSFK